MRGPMFFLEDNFRDGNKDFKNLLALFCKKYNLTTRQFKMLHEIKRAGGSISAGELCVNMNTPFSNITNISNRLKAAGLVEKQRDDGDQRKVNIVLTEKAEALLKETAMKHKRMEKLIAEEITEDEMKLLKEAHSTMQAVMVRVSTKLLQEFGTDENKNETEK